MLKILSGITGSGKSTLAKSILEAFTGQRTLCSADSFFVDPATGKYNFDPSKLSDAHGQCFRDAIYAAQHFKLGDVIVIDNTNLTTWEIAPYMALAQAYKLEAEIITVECPVEVALKRAIHGAPEEVVRRMDAALKSRVLLPWWKNTVVQGSM